MVNCIESFLYVKYYTQVYFSPSEFFNDGSITFSRRVTVVHSFWNANLFGHSLLYPLDTARTHGIWSTIWQKAPVIKNRNKSYLSSLRKTTPKDGDPLKSTLSPSFLYLPFHLSIYPPLYVSLYLLKFTFTY